MPGLPGTLSVCSPAIRLGLNEVFKAIKATLPLGVSKYLGADASAKFLPTPACTKPLFERGLTLKAFLRTKNLTRGCC